jgi:hypothetical protein
VFSAPTKSPRQKALIGEGQAVALYPRQLQRSHAKTTATSQIPPIQRTLCHIQSDPIAFVQVMADQRKESAVAFLEAAVAYFAKLGVRIDRVMTDNGSCYRSKAFRAACKRLGLRQIFTRPYTPKTNGKAERFIQTALRE